MNIALVYGGQPRFTYDFVDLMTKLRGFDSAKLYMTLWRSEWAKTEEEAITRIKKILPNQYSIGKIKIVDEPIVEYPLNSQLLAAESHGNTIWWYKRIFRQFIGLSMAYSLIDQSYDAVVRFRGDGSIDNPIDLSSIDFNLTPIIFPNNGGSGTLGHLVNDQFAIGKPDIMKFHCDIGNHISELVPLIDPKWNESDTVDGWTWQWGPEHIISFRMKQNKVPVTLGNFKTVLNTYGRSKYTDKHFHHNIAPDPTE